MKQTLLSILVVMVSVPLVSVRIRINPTESTAGTREKFTIRAPKEDTQMNDILIELFAEVLQVSPAALDDNSSPDNVKQWDSLAAMDLVAAIEEKFNVHLSTKEIMKMSTIGLARKALQSKKVAV